MSFILNVTALGARDDNGNYDVVCALSVFGCVEILCSVGILAYSTRPTLRELGQGLFLTHLSRTLWQNGT